MEQNPVDIFLKFRRRRDLKDRFFLSNPSSLVVVLFSTAEDFLDTRNARGLDSSPSRPRTGMSYIHLPCFKKKCISRSRPTFSWPVNKGRLCKPSEKMFAVFSSIAGLVGREGRRGAAENEGGRSPLQLAQPMHRRDLFNDSFILQQKGTCNTSLYILLVQIRLLNIIKRSLISVFFFSEEPVIYKDK